MKELKWMTGTIDKILIYLLACSSFSIAMIMQLISSWNTPTNKSDLVMASLIAFGFLLLILFQYISRWLHGIIIVSVANIFSLLLLYRTYINLK